jgi:hypothetical protein
LANQGEKWAQKGAVGLLTASEAFLMRTARRLGGAQSPDVINGTPNLHDHLQATIPAKSQPGS